MELFDDMRSSDWESDASGDHFLDPSNQLGLEIGVQRATEAQETTKADDLRTDQVGAGRLDDLGYLVRGSLIAIDEQSDVVSADLVEIGTEAAHLIGQISLGSQTEDNDALLVAGILRGDLVALGIDGELVLGSDHLSELLHAFFL